MEESDQNLKLVRQLLTAIDSGGFITKQSLDQIHKDIDTLEVKYKILEQDLLLRGFKDYGLEGQLRTAIHAVENSTASYDKVEILMLRRHEKDFFLRKDIKYLNDFNKRIDVLLQAAERNSSEEVLKNLVSYKALFNEVVRIDEKIGLTDSKDVKGHISEVLHNLDYQIEQLKTEIKKEAASFKRKSSNTLLAIFLIQLTLGAIMAIFYSDVMTKSITELRAAMRSLAEGQFPAPLEVKTSEEIGQTKTYFNQLLDRMEAATRFSVALGKGELNTAYPKEFSDDILAKALTRMQVELKHAHSKQEVINWNNQGLAKMNDILKVDSDNISILGDNLIKLLVQYLEMNQGVLYVLKGDTRQGRLERISTYAYDKKKFLSDSIELGQGLVGECFLQKEIVVLTDVPGDYVKITSGLGEATPAFVILVPLVIQEQAIGVMEFASFSQLEPYKVEFLKRISENVASILVNRQIHSETARLLAEAKHREQKLVQSEEELRQNAEELKAAQEQMARQQKELESKILQLQEIR